MIARIRGIIKSGVYKIRFGKRFCLQGFPQLEARTRINLKNGFVRIAQGFVMKCNAYCAIVNGGRLTIGQRVSIARNSIIVCRESISIGDDCAIAPNVAIYDHDHRFGIDGLKEGYNTAPVVIENNVWIGAGVIILRGTQIGAGSVIGAGCVVKGKIPAHSLVTSDRHLNVVDIAYDR